MWLVVGCPKLSYLRRGRMRRRRGVKMLENKDEKLSYLRRRRVRRGIEKIVMLEYGEKKTADT